MNKKTVLYVLMDAVFLIVFNTVFFTVGGFKHPASVWLSYGFIHFSYLMILATPFLIRKSSSSAVFGFSISSVSAAYFLLEFVVGLIFIVLKSETIKVALVVQIIIAGLYAITLLGNLLANEYTADAVDRKEEEVAYIKFASSRVKALISRTSDKKAEKAIERAYDILHASPTKSAMAVKKIEEEVLNKVTQLENAVASNQSADIISYSGEIIELMNERNRKLRLSQ